MTNSSDVTVLFARVLLCSAFIVSAFDKFRLPPEELQQISSLHLPAPEVICILIGIFETIAAASILLGVWSRLSAIALALFTLFVTFAFLRFWSFEGPENLKPIIRNVFAGNISIIGGLLFLAATGPGRLVVQL